MFVAEMAAGLTAGSLALRADALDFLGDAANYAISLVVVGMALTWRESGPPEGRDAGAVRPVDRRLGNMGRSDRIDATSACHGCVWRAGVCS